jgi:beta-phosphoglucomutase
LERKIEAFIFDLDGVITDTAEYHYQAWEKLAKLIGITIDRTFNEQLKGVSRMESLERILMLGNKQHEFTYEEKVKLATIKNDFYKELIKNITPADILPGINELLEDLKSNQIKIGLASSSKNAFDVIDRLNIGQYFDYIVDPATVKHGKPNPEIFMRVADAMNVPYMNCVGVEDATVGIDAIKSAGMFAVGIGDENVLSKADLVFSHTKHISFYKINQCFINYNKRKIN